MVPIIKTLQFTAIGVWLGSLITIGFAVAGTVFKYAGSTNLAGELNAHIITRIHTIELSCASILILSLSLQYFFAIKKNPFSSYLLKKKITILKTLFIITATAISFYTIFSLMPQLEHLRQNIIINFDNPTQTQQSFREYYASLHKRYTHLVSAIVLLLLATLVMLTLEKENSDEPHAS